MMNPNPIETPRDARRALNQMEGWLRRNEERFEPTDRVVLRALFEHAHTPAHARALREEMGRRLRREPLLSVEPAAEGGGS